MIGSGGFQMTLQKYLQNIKNKQVAVIGAGISNMPLIELLRNADISVTVYDKKSAEKLGDQYQALLQLGVQLVLGEQYLEQLHADVIFRTPGLHPRFLQTARAQGAVITSEMELFFAVCPCKIIGITGSDGKTTTTTLVHEILRHAGHRCHLGGNIGAPLLPRVHDMQPQDIAIVELSSFQLMDFPHSPSIAAITNISPNHLDYHKDFEEYVTSKTHIYQHQLAGERLIFNADDAVSQTLPRHPESKVAYCSMQHPVDDGAYLSNGVLYLSESGHARTLLPASEICIPGAHNIANLLMASAIVQGLCSDEDICAVARSFQGVPHRIAFIREKDGVRYYNDSIASSPTRTIAGLLSFPNKVILIAGGYDKHIPYDVLGEPICQHVKNLLLTGATADKIHKSVEAATAAEKPTVHHLPNLAEAVQKAASIATAGDVVIMSPASASFDCYKNFEERGEYFTQLVNAL